MTKKPSKQRVSSKRVRIIKSKKVTRARSLETKAGRPIEQYEHAGKQRANNPHVGTVFTS